MTALCQLHVENSAEFQYQWGFKWLVYIIVILRINVDKQDVTMARIFGAYNKGVVVGYVAEEPTVRYKLSVRSV